MSVIGAGQGPIPARRANRMRAVALASLAGSALEWYDFYLYGAASALVFNRVIFVTSDPTVSTLLAFTTFAFGYFVRPLGGLLFGRIGDVVGRKAVLVITLLVMGGATALMGVLPTYDSVGLLAPALLVLLRLAQGLGAGAEFGSAAVFSVESADPRRRGLHGAWPSTGVYVGLLLSSGAFALASSLPADAFLTWGWRVPFLASIVVVGAALVIRLRLAEAPAPVSSERAPRSPVRQVFAREKTGMVALVLAQVPQNVVSSINLAFLTAYLVGTVKLSDSIGPVATTIGTAVTAVALPLFGALSDRVGRRPVILFGIGFSAVFAFPYFWLIDGGRAPITITIAVVLSLGLGIGAMFGPQAAFFAELFTGIGRVTGLAFAREVAGALTAGTTPLIALALVAATGGGSWSVALMIVVACVIGVVGLLMSGETRGRDLSSADVAELRASTGAFR